jgi:hypothetical protein
LITSYTYTIRGQLQWTAKQAGRPAARTLVWRPTRSAVPQAHEALQTV